MSDTTKGLYTKYRVERTDGSSAPMGKHESCEYFVIDLTHDVLAVDALRAYADSSAKVGNHKLARDLRDHAAALVISGFPPSPFDGDERSRR
jgi:hypothetical protein